ncbi:MAG: hypothetical protein EOP45_20855 [Sphingobacteriaceae bacterium]|nr:MAG: hypothetical protein EOP45_20855 [Sphingobacteriaceae bacterium]
MSLVNISTTSGTTSTASLALAFSGTSPANYMSNPFFNDGTVLLWDITQPVSASQWSGCFGDTASALPAKYLNLNVMTNQSSYTWAWPSVTGSTMNQISMPSGILTLSTLMSSLYLSSTSTISAAQYQDITGVSSSGNNVLTIAKALLQTKPKMKHSGM